MKDEKDLNPPDALKADEVDDRRDALKKLGKYAAYVAPFTVMAFSSKAVAASTKGGAGKHH